MSAEDVKKYYTVTYNAGFCGTDVEVLNVEAESEEEAVELYIDEAWEHYWDYSEEHDEENAEDSLNVEPELDISATLQDGFIAEEGYDD